MVRNIFVGDAEQKISDDNRDEQDELMAKRNIECESPVFVNREVYDVAIRQCTFAGKRMERKVFHPLIEPDQDTCWEQKPINIFSEIFHTSCVKVFLH